MRIARTVNQIALASVAFVPSDGCAQRSSPAGTHASAAQDSSSAAGQFVQSFYDWYTPIALGESRVPRWWRVQSKASLYLDPALATALRSDSIARLASPETQTRETLDFDPFLSSQDPCGPNEVSGVRRDGGVFRATVLKCRAPGVEIVVEVRVVNGRWRISNVVYGGKSRDLKYWLCKWAKEDLRPQRRPASC
jgi:hypothetical protein